MRHSLIAIFKDFPDETDAGFLSTTIKSFKFDYGRLIEPVPSQFFEACVFFLYFSDIFARLVQILFISKSDNKPPKHTPKTNSIATKMFFTQIA